MDAPEAITPEPSPHTHGHLADGLLTKPIYTALIALIESRYLSAPTIQAGRERRPSHRNGRLRYSNFADVLRRGNHSRMKRTIWRWARWCVVGIAGLFAFSAIGLGLLVTWERHRIAELNRTHERPLLVDINDPILVEAHARMAGLKLSAGSDDLRFAVMPSFGKRWFAMAITERNGRGAGEVIVTNPAGELLRHETFDVPKSDLDLFLRQWDEITDDYSGEGRLLTDGNPLAFERRRGLRITSGEGNSPCHYDVLADLAAQAFDRYIPDLRDLRDPTLPATLKGKFCNQPIFALR